jgi:hypothetical protein
MFCAMVCICVESLLWDDSFSHPKYMFPNIETDKVMAVYIIVFVIWLIWMPVGINRRFSAENGCDDTNHYMNVTIACGYAYFSLVGLAFACSLCCLQGYIKIAD